MNEIKEPSATTMTESSNNSSSNYDFSKRRGYRQASYKHRGKILTIASKPHAFAIKCYDEQLTHGWDYTCEKIRNYDRNYYVEAICHDMDTYAEDGCFWKPAIEKKHYHILMKCKKRKDTKRVSAFMNELGIYFRPRIDDVLWANYGVETIGRSFEGYSLYLTHDTDKAIKDGKVQYPLENVISNHSIDELEQIRQGYDRVSNGCSKVSSEELAEIDDIAFKLGYELKNYSAWYDTLPFNIRSHSKIKIIKESYERGVNLRINENNTVLRLCIFIKGIHNTGKTYSSRKALEGKRIHTVEGGGSGKFDNLRADHEAIIISDDTCPNLLNMSDNYICRAYRRQSNNPAWAGQYFVVTSNLTFEEWVSECGIKKQDHVKALRSRFFVCEIDEQSEDSRLKLLSPSSRGTPDEIAKRTDMFLDFQKKYNDCAKNYHPDKYEIDRHEQYYRWLTDMIYNHIQNRLPIDKMDVYYTYDWWLDNFI